MLFVQHRLFRATATMTSAGIRLTNFNISYASVKNALVFNGRTRKSQVISKVDVFMRRYREQFVNFSEEKTINIEQCRWLFIVLRSGTN
jgi:Holliday junction resolvasome RuvABC endonuclease subunit